MIGKSGLFSHWTFESFAPGSIQRPKYNAFLQIHRQTDACFELLARLEELSSGRTLVDWCRVSGLAVKLVALIRDQVDQLQVMNPVEFMDAHDWVTKLGFYTRMATEHAALPASPPYLQRLEPGQGGSSRRWIFSTLRADEPALVITPALCQYFIEASDLRKRLDEALAGVDLMDQASVEEGSRRARDLVREGGLPERLRLELEIAAVDLAPGGRKLEVWAFAGEEPGPVLIGMLPDVRGSDIVDAWMRALACKYSPEALAVRLSAGLADEEHPLTVIALPEGAASPTAQLPPAAPRDPAALIRRLDQVLPRVTRLHVFKAQGEALRPEHCRSLHDLVCLCLERGLAQIFSFAGQPSLGLTGIKQLRLEIPVAINIFNLGGGLFPSAAERATVSMEDIRSIPAWSLLLGLVSPAVAWNGTGHEEPSLAPHHSSYAVLSQFFMHCTLRLGKNLYVVECLCEDGREKYVRFRFKGGTGLQGGHGRRIEVMRLILEGEGFAVGLRGDYMDAVRSGEEDVLLQRNLVCLGLMVAWIQAAGADEMEGMSPERGRAAFRSILAGSRSDAG
jgi:hypothetical protein